MSNLLTSLFTKEWLWPVHSRRSLQKSNVSELLMSLFKKRVMWMIHSWFEGIALKKQTIRSKYFDHFSSFVCPIANRSCCSLLIHSFLKSDLSDSLPLWQKSDQEQFAQVAHYKRAVGGIYSFSGANHSFALSLTKRSESVEKPLSEFPTLPVGNGRTQ